MEILLDLLDRGVDVGHVRVFRLPERSGNANVDGVEFRQSGVVRGRPQLLLLDQTLHFFRPDIGDVRPAAVDLADLPCIQVDACDRKAGASKLNSQWKTYISQPENAGARLASLDLAAQSFGGARGSGRGFRGGLNFRRHFSSDKRFRATKIICAAGWLNSASCKPPPFSSAQNPFRGNY